MKECLQYLCLHCVLTDPKRRLKLSMAPGIYLTTRVHEMYNVNTHVETLRRRVLQTQYLTQS